MRPLPLLAAGLLLACAPAPPAGIATACPCHGGVAGRQVCAAGDDCRCVCPGVRAEPATVSFGEVARGERAVAQVTLVNELPVALRPLQFRLVEGSDPGFALAAPSMQDLPGGGRRVLELAYAPVAGGAAAGAVQVTFDGPSSLSVRIPLEGRSPGGRLRCTPAPLDLGEADVGGEAGGTLACVNEGVAGAGHDGAVELRDVDATGPFVATVERTRLAAGDAVDVAVRFRPEGPGPAEGAVTFDADDPVAAPPVALRGAGVFAPCQVDLVPPEFPVTPPGGRTNAYLGFENRAPTVCRIRAARLGGCTAFGVGTELPRDVDTDGGVLPLVFQPATVGLHACDLVLDFEPAGSPSARVPLRGEAAFGGCLSVEAAPSFVSPILTCSAPATLALENLCDVEYRVDGRIVGPDAAAFGVATPFPVPAHGIAELPLTFTPWELRTYRATLELRLPGNSDALPVPLEATADRPIGVSTWTSHAVWLPTDTLFVVDNGATSGDLRTRLLDQAGDLAARAVAQRPGGDWRLAVTTTGLTADPGCGGAVRGGEDGRFVPVDGSRPRSIGHATPGADAAWRASLDVGACHRDAPATLEAALRALTPPLSTSADDPRHPERDDGNAGLLGGSGPLSLVLVSDRSDRSPLPIAEYASRLGLVRPLHVVVVTGTRGGCSNGGLTAEDGDRLLDFAEILPSATIVSACATRWNLLEATWCAHPVDRCLPFDCLPDANGDGRRGAGDARVRVNGVEVPPIDGPDGRAGWWWDEATGQLCIARRALSGCELSLEVAFNAP